MISVGKIQTTSWFKKMHNAFINIRSLRYRGSIHPGCYLRTTPDFQSSLPVYMNYFSCLKNPNNITVSNTSFTYHLSKALAGDDFTYRFDPIQIET